MLIIYFLSIISSIFLPDYFIIPVLNYYKGKVSIPENEEQLYFLPKHLGRVERLLFWLVLFLLQEQFVAFLGVWLVVKVVGNFKGWYDGTHNSRARFIIFLIGTALSIISVIIIVFSTSLIISKFFPLSLQYNPFNIS